MDIQCSHHFDDDAYRDRRFGWGQRQAIDNSIAAGNRLCSKLWWNGDANRHDTKSGIHAGIRTGYARRDVVFDMDALCPTHRIGAAIPDLALDHAKRRPKRKRSDAN